MFGGRALTAALAWALWQLGYALDCADGQLARVTGQTSAAGARLDVFCDIAGQAVLAIVVGTVWSIDGINPVFVLAFSATRSVATTLSAVNTPSSLESHGGRFQRLLRLPFDFPVQVTVIAAALALESTAVATGAAIGLAGIAIIQLSRQIVLAANS
jgi:phosphatidylglycerophosphate synthase